MAQKSRRALLQEEARAVEAAAEMEAFNKERSTTTVVAVKERPDATRQPKSPFVRKITNIPAFAGRGR